MAWPDVQNVATNEKGGHPTQTRVIFFSGWDARPSGLCMIVLYMLGTICYGWQWLIRETLKRCSNLGGVRFLKSNKFSHWTSEWTAKLVKGQNSNVDLSLRFCNEDLDILKTIAPFICDIIVLISMLYCCWWQSNFHDGLINCSEFWVHTFAPQNYAYFV
jgi:hypothetical protein